MSSAPWHDSTEHLDSAAREVAWRQWRAIGGAASSSHPAASIVDPEALTLYTIGVMEREHRFESLLSSWLEVNASLLSVQRMRNLQKLFPESVRKRVPRFSQMARAIAKHPKWAALGGSENNAGDVAHLPEVRRAVPTPLERPSALLLRLRRAFGVGANADVLAVLLGHAGRALIVKEIVDLTGYTNVAVRGALGDLTSAGFAETQKTRPQQFAVSAHGWQTLLGLRELPRWRPWGQFYAFVAAGDELSAKARTKAFSAYAFNTKARDLIERYPALFACIGAQSTHGMELDEAVRIRWSELGRWALASA
jgi:hypothetical protein